MGRTGVVSALYDCRMVLPSQAHDTKVCLRIRNKASFLSKNLVVCVVSDDARSR